jgi:hypothetical protein
MWKLSEEFQNAQFLSLLWFEALLQPMLTRTPLSQTTQHAILQDNPICLLTSYKFIFSQGKNTQTL